MAPLSERLREHRSHYLGIEIRFYSNVRRCPGHEHRMGLSNASDSANYGTQLIQYMKDKGISWTGWIYSTDWGPAMLKSINIAAATDVPNPGGNLMNKAYHDTMSVISVVDVKKPAAGAVSGKKHSINNSTIQFYCAETSPSLCRCTRSTAITLER